MRRIFLVCALFLAATLSVRAQQINPRVPPPPPPASAAAEGNDSSAPEQPIDPSIPPPPPPAEPPAPVFDPLHANRSMDVGTFYLKTGKVDAAISRFLEAAHDEPSMAKPYRLLGEAYEKKDDFPRAIEAYKKYLELLPQASDAAKVQKHISQLDEKVEKESSKANSH